jgi:hypothetical protein
MTDYLYLQTKINESYDRLKINPNEKNDLILLEEEEPSIKNNFNSDDMINYCNTYFSCFDSKIPTLCKNNNIRPQLIIGHNLNDTSYLDLLYDELLEKIDMLQQKMNIKKDNLQMGYLTDLYTKYKNKETNLNKQTKDTMFINTKNNIIQSKYTHELNKMKIYAFLIIILLIINIWFYNTFLQNKL